MVAETALISIVSVVSYLVSVQVATPAVGVFVNPPGSVLDKIPVPGLLSESRTAEMVIFSLKSTSTLPLTSVAVTPIVPAKSVLTAAQTGGCVEKIIWLWTTFIVEPVPLATALVAAIHVPAGSTVKSVSPSTDRMNVWLSVDVGEVEKYAYTV